MLFFKNMFQTFFFFLNTEDTFGQRALFLKWTRQVSKYPPCHDKCTQYRPCFACENIALVQLPSRGE